jgi:hypothetical protein
MSYADASRVVDSESLQFNIASSNLRDAEKALSQLESLEAEAKSAGRPLGGHNKDELVEQLKIAKARLAIFKMRLDTDVAIRDAYLPDEQRMPPELQKRTP